jgi:hypothetical protein
MTNKKYHSFGTFFIFSYFCRLKYINYKKMNTFKTLSTVVFSLLAFGVATAQDEGLVPISTLPASAQSFINQHFSANSIVSVWQDTEKGKVEDYTVLFADGTEIEFRADGNWKEVKSRNGQVSPKIVPTKITKYVHKNYPNVIVKEIKKGRTKYEVDLSNGVELIFNLNGKFLKIDD